MIHLFHSQAVAPMAILAAVAIVFTISVCLVERFTTKQKVDIQKLMLNMLCLQSTFYIAGAIDRVLYWQGDFVQLVILVIVGLCVFGKLSLGWVHSGQKVKK